MAERLRPLGRPTQDAADHVFTRSYPAVPQSVSRVRHAVVRFAEERSATLDTLEAIRLTSSEAAANVVEHAYVGEPGPLHLTAMCDADAIWVIVADEGRGLFVDRERPGLGCGFAWMARFSDAMTVDSASGGGLEVSLRFLR